MAYLPAQQAAPAATTDTPLYTCPALKSTIISSIAVCNRGGSAGAYRIAIRVAGAAISNQSYLAYDAALPANSSDILTFGATMGAGDILVVRASTANFSFNAFGSEVTA